jgi:hypothetical protein
MIQNILNCLLRAQEMERGRKLILLKQKSLLVRSKRISGCGRCRGPVLRLWWAIVCRLAVLWVSLGGAGANAGVVEGNEEHVIFGPPSHLVSRLLNEIISS